MKLTSSSVSFRPKILIDQKHHSPSISVSWTFRRISSNDSKSIESSQRRLSASTVRCGPSMGPNDILYVTLAIIDGLTLALRA